MKILIIIVIGIFLFGCKDVVNQIDAESWLIDSSDASLYRVLDDGDEEYIDIKGNKESELFMCWHKDDVKKWADRLTRDCPSD